MSGGAYLPVTRAVRDAANEYLAGMAASGFVPPTADQVVRSISEQRCPHGERLSTPCRDCEREHSEATA